MKIKSLKSVFVLLAFLMFVSPNYAAFFTTPVAQTAPPKALQYSEDLKRGDVETFLGRKLTRVERFGFKLNKKKFVELTNATTAYNASRQYGDRINGMAIGAFVASLLGLGLLGIVLGIIALIQINREGDRGRGFAIAGIVVGVLTTALLVLQLALLFGWWF